MIRKLNIVKEELGEEEIFEKRLFNVFVVSLPRDGSTLVSKLCEFLGVRMVYTSDDETKVAKRDAVESKRYGEVWRMQPGNEFLEITCNQWESYLSIFERPYSGCKMIIPVNGLRLDIMKYSAARVILMTRDFEEVRQSQEASYMRECDRPELRREQLRTSLVMQKLNLEQNKIPFLELDYSDLMADVPTQVKRIAEFVNSPNDILQPAIDYVDPERYRFRKDKLTVDI